MSDVSKLPQWAQKKIIDLTRQRDLAVARLDEMTDNQTPSSFYSDEVDCTGEGSPKIRRVYFQTHKMIVLHAGVLLDILLREGKIDISWTRPSRMTETVVFQPRSFQAAYLFVKESE